MLEDASGYFDPVDKWQDDRPSEWKVEILAKDLKLKGPLKFKADILDTWAMTKAGIFEVHPAGQYRWKAQNNATIQLPEKPYLAVQLRRTR